jgi:Xaa-Pro aminopeptidase
VSGPAENPVPEIARVARVVVELRKRHVDALLVASDVDLRYLTGFTGTSGAAVLDAGAGDPRHRFVTDFRYDTQSAEQVPAIFARQIASVDLLEAALGGLAVSSEQRAGNAGEEGGPRRLGFDEATMTVKQHTRLMERLPDGWELVPSGGVVPGLREIKDAGEQARVRAAAELADQALKMILEAGVVGRTERDVAIELELTMRRLGADSPSFPSIVAAAEHSALPHAEPRAVEIPPNTLLTIDWGALHDGYCSDCTRTFATGSLSEEVQEVYELVRRAQAEAIAAVRPGPSGRDVDRVAREIIERAGHGDHFGHGLGHGVGMEIHEGPRLSRTAGEQPLRAGQVVTVEPGVYLPGRFGVRIEDLAIVTSDGAESLSSLPKELTVIS